jgi:hypothetical protein
MWTHIPREGLAVTGWGKWRLPREPTVWNSSTQTRRLEHLEGSQCCIDQQRCVPDLHSLKVMLVGTAHKETTWRRGSHRGEAHVANGHRTPEILLNRYSGVARDNQAAGLIRLIRSCNQSSRRLLEADSSRPPCSGKRSTTCRNKFGSVLSHSFHPPAVP